ncbi:Rad4-domain-containing protein [Xylaria bambusicola]|uniref:Rad4-domain-containing protein n=1 Tax=Xylaria bambusicola TaxID=326684 RepID=UPI0020074490|nr:Rad4-domain-containing protein [Xylaria bambusicola]KAI0505523.1 Rad4-domain-containing protein [Xylaria bambusicola]
MAGRKRKAADDRPTNAKTPASQRPSRATRSTRSSARQSDVPDIYRDMLAEAEVRPALTTEEPSIKRKRPGQPRNQIAQHSKSPSERHSRVDLVDRNKPEPEDESEDDLEFEDMALPAATIQTVYRDSDDDDEEADEEIIFEDVDFFTIQPEVGAVQETQDLELDLSARTKSTPSKNINRRKPINKGEKDRRIEIHKTHLLCLLAHVARRNRWCNDSQVQDSLRPLLTQKMVAQLNPPSRLNQFGRANSLKEGLNVVNNMFKTKYQITERGMRRALWAETEEHLQNFNLPSDSESPLERSDFREAAKSLSGSRDVGTQLYCALLRAAGVEARLVCSLQPLSFNSAGPYMGVSHKKKQKLTLEEKYGQLFKPSEPIESPTDSSALPPRRRLGHPNAAAFRMPEISPGPSRQVVATPKKIRESPYPVYWVEILDEGHQKWQPTDPLVTGSYWKPQKLEPPASDRENSMAYVVGFEEDGTATDITRRYVKAYNAKTRRMRVEGVLSNGERWWRKALRAYSRGYRSDLDQIEANELAAIEGREPMPSNIADFKDHPIYALERHLRRHEVLIPNATPSGTVGAGSKAPLEKVYRRRDVRTARSREKWYRLGREVRPDEIPVKFLTKPSKMHEDIFSDEVQQELGEGETNGTPIYMIDQTEVYKAPPVINGKVPKNRYGNLDLYVPSMIPEGGVYIADEFGTRAAFTLGIDYAPALTGFQFHGRKGTAVLRGVVVAAECEEAMKAVIEGIKDQEVEMERERKRREVLRMWRLFLMNLRIRQRLWAGLDTDNEEMEDVGHNHSGHSDDDEAAGGGFEIDDEYAGGFLLE